MPRDQAPAANTTTSAETLVSSARMTPLARPPVIEISQLSRVQSRYLSDVRFAAFIAGDSAKSEVRLNAFMLRGS